MENWKTNRVASGYRLGERIVICANARTVADFYEECEPIIALDARAPVEEIGQAILCAFDTAQFDAPIPTKPELKSRTQRRLKAAGVKSTRQFQMRAIHCTVTQTTNALWIEPTHNGGTHGDEGGYHFLGEHRIIIALNSSPAEIGKALLDGFARCTSVFER